MRKRIAALTACGLIAAAAVAGPAQAAPQKTADSTCPSGFVCLWDQTNFTGTRILRASALLECTKLLYDNTNTPFHARSIVDNTTRTETTLWLDAPCLLNPSSPALVLSLGGQAANITPYAGAILTT
ncbi:peptidase inhibitor family I36 protein [Streptomyces sp. NPDC006711]|uniref:peptidase inhibitor family I36 protein n=1 Tax=unclassified Streptomyces TaxID=2593676 RepID=UPI0033F11E0D